ncbi:MAG: bacterial transcriptional activator domain-containing protein [Burkholderiales bacterium]|nr:bacterial transcriptional activator domain-containing protein [Burkholderiales bacterium]
MRTETSNPVVVPLPGLANGMPRFEGAVAVYRTPAERLSDTGAGWMQDEAVRIARRDLGFEALCLAQMLVLAGRRQEALDRLDQALLAAQEANDAELAFLVQAARLPVLEVLAPGAVVEVLLRDMVDGAERIDYLGTLATEARNGMPPRSGPRLAAVGLAEVPDRVGKMRTPQVAAAGNGNPIVTIRTLGTFMVAVAGKPLVSGRKLPHKPLALLQALIALGGSHVSASLLVDALWPDADGGCGRRAFDVALLRLRRLLKVDHAIVVSGGKVSLDRSLCRVDIWDFEQLVEEIEQLLPVAGIECLLVEADNLMSLYGGCFLDAEEDRSWVVPARDRLAAKFARAITLCSRALIGAGAVEQAERLYRRGLELDNLSEPLYRGLIECCLGQGHKAEALNAYRRCRELLSIVLNTRPSEETEALHRRILAAD